MRKTGYMITLCVLLAAAGCQTGKDSETSRLIHLVSIEKADEFDSGFGTYTSGEGELVAVQVMVFAPDTITAVMDSIRLSGVSDHDGERAEWSMEPIAAGCSVSSLVFPHQIVKGAVAWEDGHKLRLKREEKGEPAVLIMAGDTVHLCLGFAVPGNMAPDMRLVFNGETVRGVASGSADTAEKDEDSGR